MLSYLLHPGRAQCRPGPGWRGAYATHATWFHRGGWALRFSVLAAAAGISTSKNQEGDLTASHGVLGAAWMANSNCWSRVWNASQCHCGDWPDSSRKRGGQGGQAWQAPCSSIDRQGSTCLYNRQGAGPAGEPKTRGWSPLTRNMRALLVYAEFIQTTAQMDSQRQLVAVWTKESSCKTRHYKMLQRELCTEQSKILCTKDPFSSDHQASHPTRPTTRPCPPQGLACHPSLPHQIFSVMNPI